MKDEPKPQPKPPQPERATIHRDLKPKAGGKK